MYRYTICLIYYELFPDSKYIFLRFLRSLHIGNVQSRPGIFPRPPVLFCVMITRIMSLRYFEPIIHRFQFFGAARRIYLQVLRAFERQLCWRDSVGAAGGGVSLHFPIAFIYPLCFFRECPYHNSPLAVQPPNKRP